MMNGLHIVLDLETLSTRRNASIAAIGAAAFHWPLHEGESVPGLHVVVDVSLSPASLHIDPDTVCWWMKQSEQARDIFDDVWPGHRWELGIAILKLNQWINFVQGTEPQKEVYLWGDGSDFDCAILENAAMVTGKTLPVTFREYRDCRTIRALAQAMFTEEQLRIERPARFIEHRADHDAALAAAELVRAFTLLQEQCTARKLEAMPLPVEASALDSYYAIPELMAKFRDEGVTGNNPGLFHWQCRTCSKHITVNGSKPPYLLHYHHEWAENDAAFALVREEPTAGATAAYVDQAKDNGHDEPGT